MSPNKLVGSTAIRIATANFLVCAAAMIALGRNELVPASHGMVRFLTVLFCLLAFASAVHCFRTTYSWWMAFAKLLHLVVTTLLFSICYLLIIPILVPIVWALDPLKLRKKNDTDTFWIKRSGGGCDLESLQRMG